MSSQARLSCHEAQRACPPQSAVYAHGGTLNTGMIPNDLQHYHGQSLVRPAFAGYAYPQALLPRDSSHWNAQAFQEDERRANVLLHTGSAFWAYGGHPIGRQVSSR